MSFCTDVKNELAAIRPSECCKPSLIYGFMLFGRSFSLKKISMQTNNKNMVKAYCELVKSVYNISPEITCGGSVRPTYKAQINSASDRLIILASVDFGVSSQLINTTDFHRECCFASFLRGAFLSCGNINDPEHEYRAEFIIKNSDLADELYELLGDYGILLKKALRGKSTILYTKESGIIEDLLTLIGAAKKTLDIIDTKIMKSVKNNINRVSNCDNANISKTVEASIKQRVAIEYYEKTDRLLSLPQELLNVALLRKNNPDATLKELCNLSDEPLTVSGLNHRLSKIIALYEDLQKSHEKL